MKFDIEQQGELIIFTLLALAIFIFVTYLVMYGNFSFDSECLDYVGNRVCNESGLYYEKYFLNGGMHDMILCKEHERSKETIEFSFRKEELDGCRK